MLLMACYMRYSTIFHFVISSFSSSSVIVVSIRCFFRSPAFCGSGVLCSAYHRYLLYTHIFSHYYFDLTNCTACIYVSFTWGRTDGLIIRCWFWYWYLYYYTVVIIWWCLEQFLNQIRKWKFQKWEQGKTKPIVTERKVSLTMWLLMVC